MSLLAFSLASFVLAVTPGPGNTYVVARTVSGGRAAGLASCLGTAVGGMLHVMASALGLSLLVARSALAFNLLKYLGAAYLVWLGVQMLRRGGNTAGEAAPPARGARRALVEGIVVEAFNVKTALFFLAFLPQFVEPAAPVAPQLMLLGAISLAFFSLADVAAVLLAARLLKSNAVRAARARLLTRVSGASMIGLGIFLSLARRNA